MEGSNLFGRGCSAESDFQGTTGRRKERLRGLSDIKSKRFVLEDDDQIQSEKQGGWRWEGKRRSGGRTGDRFFLRPRRTTTFFLAAPPGCSPPKKSLPLDWHGDSGLSALSGRTSPERVDGEGGEASAVMQGAITVMGFSLETCRNPRLSLPRQGNVDLGLDNVSQAAKARDQRSVDTRNFPRTPLNTYTMSSVYSYMLTFCPGWIR